jgi:FkbM family methyltransferase
MSARTDCDAYIPHVGWLRHECGEEVIALLRQGYFEAAEQAFFWLHGRPGDVFIDGGAHIGLYSVLAHRAAAGSATIVAVEPSGATARYLAANLESNGVSTATLVRAALWKAPGEVRFAAQAQGKAAYAHVAFEGGGGDAVPATTLDEIVASCGAGAVALAKIDVEGAEPEALEGAARSIARGALPLLMVEFTEENLRRRGFSTGALRERLQGLGYTLAELDEETLQLRRFDEPGPIWFRNLFACADVAAVNARLAAAGPRERAIARDILDRARACNRFRELEDLDRLRAVEAESEKTRAWAEEAEARAASASRLSEERKTWAEEAEARAAAATRLAEERATWAGEADARAAAATRQAEDQRAWAEQAEARAAAATSMADEQRAWAERSDRMLAQAKAETDAERERVRQLEEEIRPIREFARRHPRIARFVLRRLK